VYIDSDVVTKADYDLFTGLRRGGVRSWTISMTHTICLYFTVVNSFIRRQRDAKNIPYPPVQIPTDFSGALT
jgi:hypothetical protein